MKDEFFTFPTLRDLNCSPFPEHAVKAGLTVGLNVARYWNTLPRGIIIVNVTPMDPLTKCRIDNLHLLPPFFDILQKHLMPGRNVNRDFRHFL